MPKLLRPLIAKQLKHDLTPVAGLALVGHYLRAVQSVFGRLDATLAVRGGVANSDILRSYLGLLVQGKSDFDAVENFRGDTFFKQALGIGVLPCGWLPLDVDTFAMDNGGTTKEGVGRTYAGVDGYCPLAAYLGSHFNLERVIPMAQRLSASAHGSHRNAPILLRMDSGFDAARLMSRIESCHRNTGAAAPQVDFLIKRNPRSTDVPALAARLDADPATQWAQPRAGKRVTTWEQSVTLDDEPAGQTHRPGRDRPVRRPRHAREVPFRVQDRSGPDEAALGQVRHQLPGVPA